MKEMIATSLEMTNRNQQCTNRKAKGKGLSEGHKKQTLFSREHKTRTKKRKRLLIAARTWSLHAWTSRSAAMKMKIAL
jgi:hypothetical protein